MRARRPRRHFRKGFAALFLLAALAGCATSGGRDGLAPTIDNAGVLESVLEPVFAGRDFQPLFDRLADDVVLELTISGDARPRRELRGKRRVMAFFLNEDAAYGFGQNRSLEYSGSGDRIVVRGVAGARRGVVDFVNGRIIRFLVIQGALPARVATRKYGG